MAAEILEAEIVEQRDELTVSFTPASIEANFAALDARVDALVADYDGAVYDLADAENIKQAKRDRAYLNGIAKEIDERRKAVKREYMKPLEGFESRANAIVAKVKKASADIKVQLDEAEEARKEEAYAELEEYYFGLAGLLADAVPYDRIHEARWLNKSFGIKKAEAAIDGKVAKVTSDWETLKSQRETLARYDAAEREFFASLDLGAALNAAREAQEADDRIAELERGMAEYGAAPEPEPAPEQMPEPAPEPAASVPVAEPGGGYVPCVMIVAAASRSQMEQIGRFCGSLNPRVTGKFVSGTLEEAYSKECARIAADVRKGAHDGKGAR